MYTPQKVSEALALRHRSSCDHQHRDLNFRLRPARVRSHIREVYGHVAGRSFALPRLYYERDIHDSSRYTQHPIQVARYRFPHRRACCRWTIERIDPERLRSRESIGNFVVTSSEHVLPILFNTTGIVITCYIPKKRSRSRAWYVAP